MVQYHKSAQRPDPRGQGVCHAQRRWQMDNREARLTGAQAARAVGVSRQLVRYWHEHCGLEKGDDDLYRLGDVIDMEKAKRRHSQSRRGVQLATAAH